MIVLVGSYLWENCNCVLQKWKRNKSKCWTSVRNFTSEDVVRWRDVQLEEGWWQMLVTSLEETVMCALKLERGNYVLWEAGRNSAWVAIWSSNVLWKSSTEIRKGVKLSTKLGGGASDSIEEWLSLNTTKCREPFDLWSSSLNIRTNRSTCYHLTSAFSENVLLWNCRWWLLAILLLCSFFYFKNLTKKQKLHFFPICLIISRINPCDVMVQSLPSQSFMDISLEQKFESKFAAHILWIVFCFSWQCVTSYVFYC